MLVEGRRRGECRVWPSVIRFTRRHGIPLQRTGHAHPRNSSKRGISLLRNTHKSTSLLKGSEIGKARCSVTSISSFLAPLFFARSPTPSHSQGFVLVSLPFLCPAMFACRAYFYPGSSRVKSIAVRQPYYRTPTISSTFPMRAIPMFPAG